MPWESMFGRSMFDAFESDPFFAGFRDSMRRFDHVFNEDFDPWFERRLPESDRPENPDNNPRRIRRREHHHDDPWRIVERQRDMVGDMFRRMDGMFSRIRDEAGTNVGPSYYHSSAYSCIQDGSGSKPRVYQASTSTMQGPGGLKETRKALRDSDRALEQYQYGRHINERGHVKEKKINTNTKDVEENEEFLNMNQDEGRAFDDEFNDRISSMMYHKGRQRIQGHRDPAVGASGHRNSNAIAYDQNDRQNDRQLRERDRDRRKDHHRRRDGY